MEYSEFFDTLSEVAYPGMRFIPADEGDCFLVQCGLESGWTGRKWRVSKHSTKSEVVQTCLKAVLTAVEHEAREHFVYRGHAIFGPHFDVDALVDLAKSPLALDLRSAP